MKKTLSNYIEKVPYSGETILFNKINGNIVLLESNKIIEHGEGISFLNCSDHDMALLEKYGFFIDDNMVQEYIEKNLTNPQRKKDTTVIISVTEECNLSCRYCYQKGWNKNDKIADVEYVSLIMEYIQKIFQRFRE